MGIFIAQGVFSIKYPHFKNKIHPDKIIFTPLQAEKHVPLQS